jgi:hypothetical protein
MKSIKKGVAANADSFIKWFVAVQKFFWNRQYRRNFPA